MGLRIFRRVIFTLFILSLISLEAVAQSQQQALLNPSPAPAPQPETLGPWLLTKQKNYPNYKVELHSRSTVGKFPRVESSKIRIIPTEGGSVTQYQGTWINPDPKTFITEFKPPLDLDGDGFEDLMLQNYSAGIHCCYNFVIYSLGKSLKKLGDLPLKDCGAQIRLADLNQDKTLEIIACNADFVGLGKLPFSDSPFPPSVYSLKEGVYKKSNLDFKQIFLQDIQNQRESLAKGYSPTAVLQIVADYFLMGEEAGGWKEFDTLYQDDDKEAVKAQLLERLGKPAVTPPSSSPVPMGAPLPPAKPALTPAPLSPAPPPAPTFGFPQAPSGMPKLP